MSDAERDSAPGHGSGLPWPDPSAEDIRMRIPAEIDLGAATHKGCVRATNQDYYLLLSPDDSKRLERDGVLVAVADGMGGVTGGAEASRIAIHSLGATFGAVQGDAPTRLQSGFDTACERVYRQGQADPALRDMGTTLTALVLRGSHGSIAHVGDTRCLRVRNGRVEQLTEDHAMSESRNLLTRCIGAGQEREEVDHVEIEIRSGDMFVIGTDGVWSQVEPDEWKSILRDPDAQKVAERLVRHALKKGAPDNATAVVVRVLNATAPSGRFKSVEIPSDEIEPVEETGGRDTRALLRPRWPWVVIGISVMLAVFAWLRFEGGANWYRPLLDVFR